MKHSHSGMRLVACALVLSALLTGCNDSIPEDAHTPTPPASVEGIATPSNVAVVTATNAD